MKLLTFVSALALSASALKTHIVAEDKCDETCTMVDRVLSFPEFADGLMPMFDFNISARLTEDVSTSWRYHLFAFVGPVPVWNGTGVPCGDTVVGDNVAFRLHLGLPDCDEKVGAINIAGNARVSFPGPPNPLGIKFSLDIFNGQGHSVFHIKVTLSHKFTPDSIPSSTVAPMTNAFAPALESTEPVEAYPRANISVKNCCDETCLLKDLSMNFPQHFPPFSDAFTFSVTGSFPQQIPRARFGMRAVLRILDVAPLTILLGNGSACGDTTTGDVMEFGMAIDFPSCPIPAGPYTLPGRARFTLPLADLGMIVHRIDISDNHGNRLGCVESTLKFGLGIEGHAVV